MIDLREANDDEIAASTQERTERIRAWYQRFGAPEGWTDKQVAGRLSGNTKSPMMTYALVEGGMTVGFLAVSLTFEGPSGRPVINDIWIDPAHRRRGFATEARQWAEKNAQSTSIFVSVDPEDDASRALFASYPVRAQTMVKRLVTPDPLPPGVVGRPMVDAEFEAWSDESIRGYAADMADSGTLSPDDAMERSRTQFAEIIPDGLRTAGQTFWTLDADGESVATNWLAHQHSPEVSFVYGVEVHEASRGKGYGRAAMIVGEQASLDAGDTHLALNVFGHNSVAINLYTRMGYRAAIRCGPWICETLPGYDAGIIVAPLVDRDDRPSRIGQECRRRRSRPRAASTGPVGRSEYRCGVALPHFSHFLSVSA